MRRVSLFAGLVSAAIVATVSLHALAQAKPENLIKQRKSAMALIGWYFGPLGAQVKGEAPWNQETWARNTAYIEVLSKMPIEGFQPGTDKGDTKAKPAVFSEPAKFKSAMEKMQTEVAKLAQVAKGADQAAMKAQFGETGKACKACHDDFREKD